MRLRLRWAVVLVGAALAGGAIASPPGQAPDGANANALERADLAREAMAILDQRAELGLRPGDAERVRWSRRLVDALAEAPDARDQYLKALRDHVDLMKRIEAATRLRFEQADITSLDVKEATYGRLEAEALLARAEGR